MKTYWVRGWSILAEIWLITRRVLMYVLCQSHSSGCINKFAKSQLCRQHMGKSIIINQCDFLMNQKLRRTTVNQQLQHSSGQHHDSLLIFLNQENDVHVVSASCILISDLEQTVSQREESMMQMNRPQITVGCG